MTYAQLLLIADLQLPGILCARGNCVIIGWCSLWWVPREGVDDGVSVQGMCIYIIDWHWLSPTTRFPPSFTEQPRMQLAYKLGDLVVLDCDAEAYPPAQWANLLLAVFLCPVHYCRLLYLSSAHISAVISRQPAICLVSNSPCSLSLYSWRLDTLHCPS